MKKQRWLSAAALLFVLIVSFCVHLFSNSMSVIPEDQRDLYRDENGTPYLSEMDSYYYLRLAREMSESGSAFWFNNRAVDPLMHQRSVEDSWQGDPLLLSVLAYYIWRFLSLFGEVRIVDVARMMGPVFGSLAAIPGFLYVKRRTGSLAGAVTAGLLVGVSLPFVSHTHAGFFDTDMLLAILPLGFTVLQLRAMQEKSLLRQALFSLGCGLVFGLCALTWYGFYTYFWLLVLGGFFGVLLTMLCLWRCPFRRRLLIARGWLLSLLPAVLFTWIFRGQQGLNYLLNVINAFLNVSGSRNVFPFAQQYTGEMQAMPLLPSSGFLSFLRADLGSGLGCLGGLIPCVLAAAAVPLGIAFALRRPKASAGRHEALIGTITEAATLILLLGFGVVLMRSRRRFAEIAALPAAILAGLGVGFLARALKRLKACWRVPARAVLAVGSCVPLLLGSSAVARSAVPDVTDSLAGAMAYIRETQPENAVIASWWDYGYYMQYESRHRAFMDGGTGSGIMNYYVSKALLSDDPALSAGIFRAMESAATSTIDNLVRLGATQSEAAKILLQIAPLSRAEAAEALTLPMTEEQREELLDRTHPKEENPILLVLTTDMLAKMEALSYFALWNTDTLSKEGNVYWLAGASSEELLPGGEADFTFTDPSITLHAWMEEDGFVRVSQTQDGKAYALSRLCVWRDGEKTQDIPLPGNGPVTILIQEEGRTALFSCSPNLADSLFVRLYVCMDKTLDGAKLLGAWEGLTSGDPCPAQRRLNVTNRSCQSTQVWDISALQR